MAVSNRESCNTATVRALEPAECIRIYTEMGRLWLPSKQRLLYKMAEILIGDLENPHEIVSLYRGFDVERPAYSRAGSYERGGKQLIAVTRLANQRLKGDNVDRPASLKQMAAVRGANWELRIDERGSFGNMSFPGVEKLMTAAWVCLTADDVVKVQTAALEEGVGIRAVLSYPDDSEQRSFEDTYTRPDLRLIHN